MSFPFIVAEQDLPKRSIVLQKRSLPYQGVAWGGEAVVDINYNPGNPVAQAQVVGQRWTPTTITGKWKDIFLSDGESTGKLINFPQLSPALVAGLTERGGETFQSTGSIPEQGGTRARILRDAFTLLRKSCSFLRVEWGSLVRYGFITRDNFTHDREEDIEFEIEFTWTGDTASQPTFSLPQVDLLGLLKQLLALLDALLNQVLTALFVVESYVTRVTQGLAAITSLISAVIEIVGDVVNLTLVPVDVLTGLRGQLKAIVQETKLLFQGIAAGTAAQVEAAFTGSPQNVAEANQTQQDIRAALIAIAAQASRDEQRIAQAIVPQLLGIYVSPGGITLRDVSTRYYGTPTNWGAIADFNGFAGSLVPRGQLVRVPRL